MDRHSFLVRNFHSLFPAGLSRNTCSLFSSTFWLCSLDLVGPGPPRCGPRVRLCDYELKFWNFALIRAFCAQNCVRFEFVLSSFFVTFIDVKGLYRVRSHDFCIPRSGSGS